MTKQTFIFVSLLLFILGCKKEADNGFEWVKEGNKLYYDYISENDTLKEALILTIKKQPDSSDPTKLRFAFNYTFNNYDSMKSTPSVGSEYNVKVKEGELFKSSPRGCGFVSILSFEFLRAPAKPNNGFQFPDYRCDTAIETTYTISNINTDLVVPAGTFKTYCMTDPNLYGSLKKEFWDSNNGLIKIQIFNKDTLTGEYNLSKKNF